jgi:hypothetical protein
MDCPRTIFSVLLAAALLPLAGCGSSNSVSGHVTYEAKPVANGSISFLPADGHGSAAGGPIVDGVYQIENLIPGMKIVQIVAVKTTNVPASHEERQRQAIERAKRGDTTSIVERADEIPADAEGNNRQFEIKPGSQTLDFDLKPKARP